MNRPVSRRTVLGASAVTAGAFALPAAISALAAEMPCTSPMARAPFDAAAFLADLKAAGCRVHLALPATVFRPEDDRPTYLISWPPQTGAFQGYCAVMAKWSDAMEACSDHVDLVTARLAEMRGATF